MSKFTECQLALETTGAQKKYNKVRSSKKLHIDSCLFPIPHPPKKLHVNMDLPKQYKTGMLILMMQK